ncbi:MAG: cytochrome b/b6 domain-containing protein [Magnetovibrio sp.]|nr:cytochrome b/b6 domain-containing protein [Magnetovibrio sp.]
MDHVKTDFEAHSGPQTQSNQRPVKVWDLPTRVFHWGLVVLIAVAWISAEAGQSVFWVHVYSGSAVLGFIAFRLVWGVMGSCYARFDNFVHGPEKVMDYAKKLFAFRPPHHVGHNPLGGWMVVALISSIMVIALTGLMTSEDGFVGPLAHIGSGWLGEGHEAIGSILIALIIVHVAGVLVHGVISRENLPRAMVSGIKHVPADEKAEDIKPIGLIRPVLAVGAGIAVATYFLWI